MLRRLPCIRRAEALQLPQMISDNKDRNGTAFTVSCDAREGTTTGASAHDRAATIKLLASADATAGASLVAASHVPNVQHGQVLTLVVGAMGMRRAR